MDLAGLTFEIVRERMPGWTEERFKEAVKEYDFSPVMVGGETVGAVMHRGPELHVSVLPHARKRWFNKSIRAFIADKIREYGYVATVVEDGHDDGHRFAERLGFKRVEPGIPGFVIYRLEKTL